VNDASEVAEVVASGANGLVSDRCDVAHRVFVQEGLIASDVTKNVDKSVVNTTKSYFVPIAAANEVHVCVSALCVILPLIFNNSAVIMPALVSVLVVAVFLLSTPPPPATDNKKKKKAE
jgi:hypothetical protein